jgi:hypothetical protein
MTHLNAHSGIETHTADIAWYNPESNLWVAAFQGEHAGVVEFVDGHFSVRNSTGAIVAETTSIPAAQAALALHLQAPAAVPSRTVPPRPIFKRAPRPVYFRGALAA